MARRRVAIGTNFGDASRCLTACLFHANLQRVMSDFRVRLPVSRERELSPLRDATIRAECGVIPACVCELFEFETWRTTAYFRPIVGVPLAAARLNLRDRRKAFLCLGEIKGTANRRFFPRDSDPWWSFNWQSTREKGCSGIPTREIKRPPATVDTDSQPNSMARSDWRGFTWGCVWEREREKGEVEPDNKTRAM